MTKIAERAPLRHRHFSKGDIKCFQLVQKILKNLLALASYKIFCAGSYFFRVTETGRLSVDSSKNERFEGNSDSSTHCTCILAESTYFGLSNGQKSFETTFVIIELERFSRTDGPEEVVCTGRTRGLGRAKCPAGAHLLFWGSVVQRKLASQHFGFAFCKEWLNR